MGDVSGRRVLVTGVSRRVSIGAAVCRRLIAGGAQVYAAGWAGHDDEMPWGADDSSATAALEGLAGSASVDLAEPAAPEQLIARAAAALGGLDALVLAHARSSHYGLGALTSAELDLTFAVNVRASLLLVQAWAAGFDGDDGRVLLFTSGQARGPMPNELPYIASKAALRELTWSLSDALVDRGITVNCLNPGPVDTGYASGKVHATVAGLFPRGRWTTPNETAGVVAWLLSPDAAVITGEVLDSEAGFRR